MKELLENERIDDLEYKGLRIIQNKDGFCFGIDSILLADYAKGIKKESKVIDLGTGTGIIGIMLCAKTEIKHITGIEVQEEVCKMAERSIKLNNMEKKFNVINKNIKEIEEDFELGTYDAVVTNPPYKKQGTGLTNESKKKLISRHEITATLEDFIKTSSKLLKDKGDLYMVHRPDRLADIMELLRKYKIEPKNMKFVHPNIKSEPKLILIKATKNAKQFLKIEKPLYIYEENGKYTKEILKIYNKEI